MDDEPESRLLNLPPELRNRIYEFVFAGSYTQIERPVFRPYHVAYHPPSAGILMACKQTNQEASDHHFHLTTFEFTAFLDLFSFLACLPSRYSKLVSNIRFDSIARYHAAVGVNANGPVSMLAECAQMDVFWIAMVINDLKKAGSQVPANAKVEVCIQDWRPSRPRQIWTTAPWSAFVDIFADMPDEKKGDLDKAAIVQNRRFFEQSHADDFLCWFEWSMALPIKERKCLCTSQDKKET